MQPGRPVARGTQAPCSRAAGRPRLHALPRPANTSSPGGKQGPKAIRPAHLAQAKAQSSQHRLPWTAPKDARSQPRGHAHKTEEAGRGDSGGFRGQDSEARVLQVSAALNKDPSGQASSKECGCSPSPGRGEAGPQGPEWSGVGGGYQEARTRWPGSCRLAAGLCPEGDHAGIRGDPLQRGGSLGQGPAWEPGSKQTEDRPTDRGGRSGWEEGVAGSRAGTSIWGEIPEATR